MPTLTLSMIVKNGEKTLPRCLDSVRGLADEIVIADTGSTDHSIEIARRYGAEVFSIPWEDDFAKARNLSLARATCDWVLMLDCDEMLDPDTAKVLPTHLAARQVMGYTVTIRNYVQQLNFFMWDQRAKRNEDTRDFVKDLSGYADHVNTRLFRRHPEVYFQGRVHETVGYRLYELGMRMDQAEFIIHHFGFLNREQIQANKAVFYRELGRQKVRDLPDNSLSHFELGVEEALHFHNYGEAAEHFHKAAQLNPRFGPGWLYYGRMLTLTGEHRGAIEAYARAEETSVNRTMLLDYQGESHYALGDFKAARSCYQKLHELEQDDPSIESKLGFTEVRLGLTDEGLRRLRHAIGAAPGNVECHDRLITACLWLGKLEEAAEAAERKLETSKAQPECFLRAATMYVLLNRWQRVLDLVKLGLEHFPKDPKLNEGLLEARRQLEIAEMAERGDVDFRNKDYAAACEHYRDTLARLSASPVVESKLGIAEVRAGWVEEGLARLQKAVKQLPQAIENYDRLITACLETGRAKEAALAAEDKLRHTAPRPEIYLLAAGLSAQAANLARAATLAEEGLGWFPDDQKLRQLAVEIERLAPQQAAK